ncbi:MAG: hypothetical protein ACRDZR_08080 [Acidimicrobiales bacterium]
MGTTATIRTHVELSPPGTFFRPLDFDAPRAAVDSALSRLCARRADLVRVGRGLYWKGVSSRYGPGRPPAVDVANAACGGRGVGPSGWTAAQALGLTTQVPAVPELSVVGPVPARVKGVVFHRRSNLARLDLSYLDVALLEVLRDDVRHVDGGWEALIDRVTALRREGDVHLDRVARAVPGERSPAARYNLARMLDRVA